MDTALCAILLPNRTDNNLTDSGMTIIINSRPVDVPDGISLAELASIRQIPSKGTAIAVNSRHVPRDKWTETKLQPSDNVLVISASYGG